MEPLAAAVAEFLRSAHGEDAGDRLVIPGWGQREWESLFACTQPVKLDAGEVLIQPRGGDRALYFIASGQLELVRIDDAAGGISPIVTISQGSVVGELAFFDGKPRSAKVWAVTPALLLKFTLEDYQRYLGLNAAEAVTFLFAMGRLLSYRLRNPVIRPASTVQAARSSG